MVGYWDRDLRNRIANAAYRDYFGLAPEQIFGMHLRDVLGAELFALNLPFVDAVLAGEPQLFDREIPDPAGRLRYTQASYIPDAIGDDVRGFFVLVTDITARRVAEQRRDAAERRFRTLFEAAPIGKFLLGADGAIVDANPAAIELLGIPRERLIGTQAESLTHPHDVATGRRNLGELLDGRIESYRSEKRYVRGDGSVVWAQLDARLLRDADDGSVQVLSQVQDISERRQLQLELEHMAVHDELTGLLNRRGLGEALEHERLCSPADALRSTLLVVDLDNFKELNDERGHAAGDHALKEVARLLRSRVRESDAVARIGGDEFVIVLSGASPQEAESVARAARDLIRHARLGSVQAPISASIGIARLRPDDTPALAVERADRAMYRVKRSGGDAVASTP